ncbi:MAG: TonB-dependent receptor [Proteobacteria bacterium]|nr:TonB-dependent receptor [Pseudomonadota bacterium]
MSIETHVSAGVPSSQYKLSTEVAVRHEHYSDFGGTTSAELSGRYAFTPVVAVRATASTGFRALSLQQEYYSSTAINFITGVPYTIRTFQVTDPAAKALGARPLQPELSHNYSVGLVLTPHNGLYTTIDAYQITIAHRIILSGNLFGTAVGNYLTSAGIPFVEGAGFSPTGSIPARAAWIWSRATPCSCRPPRSH